MGEEETGIQRPGRLLPLQPLQIPEPRIIDHLFRANLPFTAPRRRLSQSWTENLEESSTSDVQKYPSIDAQRSPLQKVAAFFSDPISPIARVGKLQKQVSLLLFSRK